MYRRLQVQQRHPAAPMRPTPVVAVPAAPSRRAAVQPDPEVVALVVRVADGDHAAFEELVQRFDAPLRRAARRYRLSCADVDDVMQFTWLRLWEAASTIREPAAVAGWLATTLRRRCMHVLQGNTAEMPTDDPELGERAEPDAIDDALLALDRRRAVADAIAELPDRHRKLMTLLTSDEDLSYRELAEALGVSVGWIGPTRARCIERLRSHVALRIAATGERRA